MAKRDYYKVLGVTREASGEQIKKAFRKLARKYHPDVTGGDKKAEDRFKEINEAYEVLSDQEMRQQYDQFGHDGPTQGFGGGMDGFGGVNMEDILRGFSGFGGGGSPFGEGMHGRVRQRGGPRRPARNAAPPPSRGVDLRLTLKVDFVTAARGGSESITYRRQVPCEECGGSGRVSGSELNECPICAGRGKTDGMQGPIQVEQSCTACAGTGKTSLTTCSRCGGEGRSDGEERLTVKVPEGIRDGGRIRLAGKGNSGTRGGWPGDLIIELEVKPHPYLRRDGKDVHLVCPLSASEAVNGTKVEVPTLDGPKTLSVPAGVRCGQRLRMRGKGMTDPRSKGQRGHQFVEIQLVLPKDLNDEEKQALAAIDERTGFHPRAKLWG